MNKIDFQEVIQVYTENGWGKQKDYDSDRVMAIFENSQIKYFAMQKGDLVGFLRGLTDYKSTTWIAEIIIRPSSQRNGIGSKLLNELIKEYGEKSIFAETFNGKEAFFEQRGIKARRNMIVVSLKKN